MEAKKIQMPNIDEIQQAFASADGRSHRKGVVSKDITIEQLRRCFHMPITEVSCHFGICTTLLKKVCRRLNIKRWPHRQIRKIDNCIQSLQVAMQNADTDAERQLFRGQIGALKIMRKSVVDDPNGPHVALGASSKGLKIGHKVGGDQAKKKRRREEKGCRGKGA